MFPYPWHPGELCVVLTVVDVIVVIKVIKGFPPLVLAVVYSIIQGGQQKGFAPLASCCIQNHIRVANKNKFKHF